jgi:tellurite resistance protein
MPVTTRVRLDVRFVVEVDGQFLLRLGPDRPPRLALPGGSVADGEPVATAVSRLLAALVDGPADLDDAQFVGCVEHGDLTIPNSHTLTVLYAVDADGRQPVRVPGDAFVDATTLTRTPGIPAPLATAAVRWAEDGWPVWYGLAVTGSEPWWDGLRRSVRSVRAQLAARREHLADVEFRDAAVAMCALVAAADGRIDSRERAAMLEAMAADPVLSQFATDDVERLFDAHVDRLSASPDAGRRAAYRDVARLRGRPGQARAVIALGGVIGRADGVFDALERAAVRRAADVLDVDATDFAVQAVSAAGRSAQEET